MLNKLSISLKLVILVVAVFTIVNGSGCKKNSLETNSDSPSLNLKNSLASPEQYIPEFVVDQSNNSITTNNSYNIILKPMGQEFIPSLYALDAIELKLEDASCSVIGGTGGDLKLLIREETITGKIIATSETVHFSNCFHDVIRFNFLSFVPVLPGKIYVMEAVHVSGNTAVLYVREGANTYTGGSFIMNGKAIPDKDLWFTEGLYNFVARTKQQVKDIGWQNLVRRDGTTFKNQGDCMQYINNGH